MNEHAKTRIAVLKRLREEHRETVTRTQAWLKAQTSIQQLICQALRNQPRTVPDVAQATALPTHEVLWQITALRKYGGVVETGMSGDYCLYQLAKKTTP